MRESAAPNTPMVNEFPRGMSRRVRFTILISREEVEIAGKKKKAQLMLVSVVTVADQRSEGS